MPSRRAPHLRAHARPQPSRGAVANAHSHWRCPDRRPARPSRGEHADRAGAKRQRRPSPAGRHRFRVCVRVTPSFQLFEQTVEEHDDGGQAALLRDPSKDSRAKRFSICLGYRVPASPFPAVTMAVRIQADPGTRSFSGNCPRPTQPPAGRSVARWCTSERRIRFASMDSQERRRTRARAVRSSGD